MIERNGYITRAECMAIEKARDDKMDETHKLIAEIFTDVKAILAWQNQFKGGINVIVFLVGAGVLGTVIAWGIKLYRSIFHS